MIMTLVLVVLLRSMMMLVLFLLKVPLPSPILIIWLWPSWPWCWCMGWCWGWSWCWWWCWCCSCWKCHSHPHNLVVTILEWKVDTPKAIFTDRPHILLSSIFLESHLLTFVLIFGRLVTQLVTQIHNLWTTNLICWQSLLVANKITTKTTHQTLGKLTSSLPQS